MEPVTLHLTESTTNRKDNHVAPHHIVEQAVPLSERGGLVQPASMTRTDCGTASGN